MVKYSTEKKQQARREEIIDACEKLYRKMSFKDITMKEIGKETSFTRPSIYNYFHTKEEIFLALLKREYVKWGERLQEIAEKSTDFSVKEFADVIALSLEEREQLLKLLSINYYEMEENSRLERLADFKIAFKKTFDLINGVIKKFFPNMAENEKDKFLYAFFPFMFGIYPYTHSTEKQISAMKEAGINYVQNSVYSLVYNFIIKILK